MNGRTIVILENRAGEQMRHAIERRGARVLWIPVLDEVPDMDPNEVATVIASHRAQPFDLAVFQTGVGTRALFEAAARGGLDGALRDLLAQAKVAARGPKPSAVLRGQKVRIDYTAAEPYTTDALLAAIPLDSLRGKRVLVQRHGEVNQALHDALSGGGAAVEELPLYRWQRRDQNIVELLDVLRREAVDAVVFTSMAQVHALFTGDETQRAALRAALVGPMVCSIGPVCSAALREAGVAIALEPSPPKLGALFEAMDKALPG